MKRSRKQLQRASQQLGTENRGDAGGPPGPNLLQASQNQRGQILLSPPPTFEQNPSSLLLICRLPLKGPNLPRVALKLPRDLDFCFF